MLNKQIPQSVKQLSFAGLLTVLLSASCSSFADAGQRNNETGSVQETAAPLTLRSFTASEAGFLANSVLIEGKKESILVDAQFTLSDAQKVVEEIQKSGKTLKTIFITHGHPDHYFGLQAFLAAFPNVEVFTTPAVLADMQETATAKLNYWKPIYKDDLTSAVIFPKPLATNHLELEGKGIEIKGVVGAEAHSQNILIVPSAGAAILGDLLYSKVHLWLAEGRASQWKNTLREVQRMVTAAIEKDGAVFPGHGKAPEKGDVSKLFADNLSYIEAFETAVQQGSAVAAKEALKKRFADYALPVIVDISVDAAFAAKN